VWLKQLSLNAQINTQNNEQIMTQDQKEVKSESKATIQRGKHNKENPYVVISKKMFWDKALSPKTKGVLGFLLTLPENWKAHPSHLADCLGVGKDQIYSSLKEMIKAGYATRTKLKGEKGQYGVTVYEFFEEKIEVTEEIKEKSTTSGKTVTENPDMENPPLISNNSNKYLDNDISSLKVSLNQAPIGDMPDKSGEVDLSSSNQSKKKQEHFPEVLEVTDKIIETLKDSEPDYSPPKNLDQIRSQVDFMLRLDKREPQKILDILAWALSDSFWRDKMFKPNPAKYLREKFLQLKNKMEALPAKKDRKFLPSSDQKRAYELAQEMEDNAI
jgi:DNA-binding transcriptional regulator GbsR (MarR family)